MMTRPNRFQTTSTPFPQHTQSIPKYRSVGYTSNFFPDDFPIYIQLPSITLSTTFIPLRFPMLAPV